MLTTRGHLPSRRVAPRVFYPTGARCLLTRAPRSAPMADERKKGRPAPRVGRNGGTGARGDASQPRGERGRADRGARTDPQRSPRRTEQPRSQQASDRRPERTRRSGPPDPPTDPDVTGRELDDDVRAELSTLSGGASGAVARHLVMAGRLLDDDARVRVLDAARAGFAEADGQTSREPALQHSVSPGTASSGTPSRCRSRWSSSCCP